ncbi:MAG: hypothetical protein KDD44_14525, partial [Bdellovibrionales bacterium]|nr:hypothetical protein [Bdellovibrionales bacterium]
DLNVLPVVSNQYNKMQRFTLMMGADAYYHHECADVTDFVCNDERLDAAEARMESLGKENTLLASAGSQIQIYTPHSPEEEHGAGAYFEPGNYDYQTGTFTAFDPNSMAGLPNIFRLSGQLVNKINATPFSTVAFNQNELYMKSTSSIVRSQKVTCIVLGLDRLGTEYDTRWNVPNHPQYPNTVSRASMLYSYDPPDADPNARPWYDTYFDRMWFYYLKDTRPNGETLENSPELYKDDMSHHDVFDDADYAGLAGHENHPNPGVDTRFKQPVMTLKSIKRREPASGSYKGFTGPEPLTSIYEGIRHYINRVVQAGNAQDLFCFTGVQEGLSWPSTIALEDISSHFAYLDDYFHVRQDYNVNKNNTSHPAYTLFNYNMQARGHNLEPMKYAT